jgi:hypothetical protein
LRSVLHHYLHHNPRHEAPLVYIQRHEVALKCIQQHRYARVINGGAACALGRTRNGADFDNLAVVGRIVGMLILERGPGVMVIRHIVYIALLVIAFSRDCNS